jgi:hypothetical protein
MAATAIIAPGSYDTAVLATGNLASYWKLNDTTSTAIDSADSDNGTYHGTYTQSQTPPSGDMSKGTLFDGTTGYVLAGLPFNSTASISLECWFKTTNAAGSNQTIIYNGQLANNGYGLVLNGNNNTNGHIQYLKGGIGFTDTGIVIADTNWHHVVYTLDSGHVPRVYIDGVLGFTGSAGTPLTPTVGLGVGQGADVFAGYFFSGTLAAGAAYSTPLSAATVLAHYQAGSASTSVDFGAWHSLDGQDVNGGNGILFSWWMNVLAWDVAYQQFWQHFVTGTSGWYFRRDSSNDGIQFVWTNTGGTADLASTGVSFAGQGWQHCAALCFGGVSLLYVSGGAASSQGGGPPTSSFATNTAHLLANVSPNIQLAELAIYTANNTFSGSSNSLRDYWIGLVGLLSKGFSPVQMPLPLGTGDPGIKLLTYQPLIGAVAEPDCSDPTISGAGAAPWGPAYPPPRLFGRIGPDFDEGPLFLTSSLSSSSSSGQSSSSVFVPSSPSSPAPSSPSSPVASSPGVSSPGASSPKTSSASSLGPSSPSPQVSSPSAGTSPTSSPGPFASSPSSPFSSRSPSAGPSAISSPSAFGSPSSPKASSASPGASSPAASSPGASSPGASSPRASSLSPGVSSPAASSPAASPGVSSPAASSPQPGSSPQPSPSPSPQPSPSPSPSPQASSPAPQPSGSAQPGTGNRWIIGGGFGGPGAKVQIIGG